MIAVRPVTADDLGRRLPLRAGHTVARRLHDQVATTGFAVHSQAIAS